MRNGARRKPDKQGSNRLIRAKKKGFPLRESLSNQKSLVQGGYYLKSFGRRSVRLHLEHSATFFSFPLSNRVFITISPPQVQKNLCVAMVVREFLLAPPMSILLKTKLKQGYRNRGRVSSKKLPFCGKQCLPVLTRKRTFDNLQGQFYFGGSLWQ